MGNVLAFCLGMLVTYYFAAALSHGVYSMKFIIGWTVFALCSPVMAYFAWLSKERGIFAKIVGVGIVAVSILSSILLFDRLRIYDFLIDGMLIYFPWEQHRYRHLPRYAARACCRQQYQKRGTEQ